MYLLTSLELMDKMPQSLFDEVIEKYVEMNVSHPFREKWTFRTKRIGSYVENRTGLVIYKENLRDIEIKYVC